MDRNDLMEKAQRMVDQVDDMPTIPAVATQVLHLLDQPDTEIEEIANLMLSDPVMTARILKLINSPVFRPEREITSLKMALIYLGMRHIREVALTTSLISAFGEDTGALKLDIFWEHSFGVGMTSKIIAKKVGYKDLEKAYIAGIIHDLGEVFLSTYMREEFNKLLASIKNQPSTLVDAEIRQLGTSHCEIGLCMAQKWNFPEAYCEVIAHHHAPAGALTEPVLCAIVNLADLFCCVRGLDYAGQEWVCFNLEEEEGWQILKKLAPHLAEMDVERFCYELDDSLSDIRALVDSIFGVKRPSEA